MTTLEHEPQAPQDSTSPNLKVTVTQLYKQLQLHDNLILTCTPESVPSLKKRISKRKYLEGKKLGDFAEKSLVLSFLSIPIPDSDLIKLHISLLPNVSDALEGIAGVTAAATMDNIVQGTEPEAIIFEHADEVEVETEAIEEDIFGDWDDEL